MAETQDWPLDVHDAFRLQKLLTMLNRGGWPSGAGFEAARREAAELLRRVGHYDWNGVRYSLAPDGSIRRGLPW